MTNKQLKQIRIDNQLNLNTISVERTYGLIPPEYDNTTLVPPQKYKHAARSFEKHKLKHITG